MGERHRADIRTEHGLTIEFQRSPITPDERVNREKFDRNMVWVVDGSRLSRDLPRFAEGSRSFRALAQGVYITPFPEDAFPKS